ncbi:membrane-associated proteins in eicosanoid and glutathione metabolism [Ascobolus immersus RN42]|uniref:Membrane-associated proteins in eicosanoid and glutathione metabolism n=1 Tax=Ascobolus immersus RN42 TaxID=1160509 RepID=A0A3N4J208_ASCIM|nr:membrane-associated proteins in eicosanoid and glutathione metabolism [Ascobolus immersus RN42]
MATITVSPEFGYVAATAVASHLVSLWIGIKVSGARKAANVPYPNAYATSTEAATSPAKYKFNCWQRAHANYLETYPGFLTMLFIAGLKYPTYAAGSGAIYLVGRIFYSLGYANSPKPEGKGRYNGAFFHLGLLSLLGLSGKVAWDLVSLNL